MRGGRGEQWKVAEHLLLALGQRRSAMQLQPLPVDLGPGVLDPELEPPPVVQRRLPGARRMTNSRTLRAGGLDQPVQRVAQGGALLGQQRTDRLAQQLDRLPGLRGLRRRAASSPASSGCPGRSSRRPAACSSPRPARPPPPCGYGWRRRARRGCVARTVRVPGSVSSRRSCSTATATRVASCADRALASLVPADNGQQTAELGSTRGSWSAAGPFAASLNARQTAFSSPVAPTLEAGQFLCESLKRRRYGVVGPYVGGLVERGAIQRRVPPVVHRLEHAGHVRDSPELHQRDRPDLGLLNDRSLRVPDLTLQATDPFDQLTGPSLELGGPLSAVPHSCVQLPQPILQLGDTRIRWRPRALRARPRPGSHAPGRTRPRPARWRHPLLRVTARRAPRPNA